MKTPGEDVREFYREQGRQEERERIIKLLEGKQLGCPCGCHNWMEPWALIALIKGENK